jgi:hypothetical protein
VGTQIAAQWFCSNRTTTEANIAVWADQDDPLVSDAVVLGKHAIRIAPSVFIRPFQVMPSDGIDLQQILPVGKLRLQLALISILLVMQEDEKRVAVQRMLQCALATLYSLITPPIIPLSRLFRLPRQTLQDQGRR